MAIDEEESQDREEVPEFLDPLQPSLSQSITEPIIAYIGGFIVRKLQKTKCDICFQRLFSSHDATSTMTDASLLVDNVHESCSRFDLIELRDRGGLIKPSKEVIKICQKTELVIKGLTEQDLCSRLLLQRIRVSVLNDFIVPFPNDHECGLNSHSLQLTKSIIDVYVKVRLFHLSRQVSERASGRKIRSKLTKTILFCHQ